MQRRTILTLNNQTEFRTSEQNKQLWHYRMWVTGHNIFKGCWSRGYSLCGGTWPLSSRFEVEGREITVSNQTQPLTRPISKVEFPPPRKTHWAPGGPQSQVQPQNDKLYPMVNNPFWCQRFVNTFLSFNPGIP